MDIRPIDIHDDDQLRAVYDVAARAETLGREDAPHWTHEEFVGIVRSPDSGERQEVVGGFVEGQLVATGTLYLSLLDNLDKGWFQVQVDPDHRRRGHGRAVVEHIAAIAGADGRTELLTDTKVPLEGVDEHPYARFLTSLGFSRSNVEVVRYLHLPVDGAEIQQWSDEAAASSEGYRVETFVDDVPDELVPSLCLLLGQLAVDAPTGDVDFEEEKMTPLRFAERQAAVRAMGRTVFETLAIAPDGVVAAQSTLAVPLDGGTDVWQWGTFVHREHRGRRLGLATKAANLRALQDVHPDKHRIVTQNAETNDFMVSINERIGFAPVEASAEYVRRS